MCACVGVCVYAVFVFVCVCRCVCEFVCVYALRMQNGLKKMACVCDQDCFVPEVRMCVCGCVFVCVDVSAVVISHSKLYIH